MFFGVKINNLNIEFKVKKQLTYVNFFVVYFNRKKYRTKNLIQLLFIGFVFFTKNFVFTPMVQLLLRLLHILTRFQLNKNYNIYFLLHFYSYFQNQFFLMVKYLPFL